MKTWENSFPSVHHQIHLLIHQTVHPSAENVSEIPSNHGDKNVVYCLDEISAKSQSVDISCITSVIAPICASSILSVHLSDDKSQEIPDEFPGTNYGRKPHLKQWHNSPVM